jgi:hypothetical protein
MLKFVTTGDRPGRQHERGWHVHQVPGGEAQRGHRRRVGPLEIVDCNQQRSLQGGAFEKVSEAFDDPELGRSLVDETGDLDAEWISRRHPAAQRVSQWPERSCPLELLSISVKPPDSRGTRENLGQKPGLADPRFALYQYDLAPSRPPADQPLANRVELGRPAEQATLYML